MALAEDVVVEAEALPDAAPEWRGAAGGNMVLSLTPKMKKKRCRGRLTCLKPSSIKIQTKLNALDQYE